MAIKSYFSNETFTFLGNCCDYDKLVTGHLIQQWHNGCLLLTQRNGVVNALCKCKKKSLVISSVRAVT